MVCIAFTPPPPPSNINLHFDQVYSQKLFYLYCLKEVPTLIHVKQFCLVSIINEIFNDYNANTISLLRYLLLYNNTVGRKHKRGGGSMS